MAGTSGQHLLGEERGGGNLGPRVNIWGFGSTRCSHVSPHICVTFPRNSSPSLFMSSYKSKYVHLEISRPQQKQHLCFSRPRGSLYFAVQKYPFLNCAKSVLCKKLHGQNCSFSSRVPLVVLREVASVVCGPSQRRTTKLFIPGHTTLVQPPITLHQAPPGALRGNKANLVDRFQNVIQGTADDRSRGVDDFPDSAVGHGFVSVGA